MFSAPAVHALHGHAGKAGVSFLLHAPGALLFSDVEQCDRAEVDHCPGDDGGFSIEGPLAFLVILGGALVDGLVVAYEDVPPPSSWKAEQAHLRVDPWVTAEGTRGVLVGGTY